MREERGPVMLQKQNSVSQMCRTERVGDTLMVWETLLLKAWFPCAQGKPRLSSSMSKGMDPHAKSP